MSVLHLISGETIIGHFVLSIKSIYINVISSQGNKRKKQYFSVKAPEMVKSSISLHTALIHHKTTSIKKRIEAFKGNLLLKRCILNIIPDSTSKILSFLCSGECPGFPIYGHHPWQVPWKLHQVHTERNIRLSTQPNSTRFNQARNLLFCIFTLA